MLEGDDLGAGHLPSFFVPTPGHLPISFKKMLMPGGWPGGGGGWALLELTDALLIPQITCRPQNAKET